MNRTIAMVLSLAMTGTVAAETPAVGGDDEVRVREVVETYLHGLKFNDVESLRKAFWSDARLLFVKKNGELGQLTQESWYKGFNSVAGKEEDGTLHIISIEVTGVAAVVKVEEVYPKARYVNYLSLLRVSGDWKIVNKIFDMKQVEIRPTDGRPVVLSRP